MDTNQFTQQLVSSARSSSRSTRTAICSQLIQLPGAGRERSRPCRWSASTIEYNGNRPRCRERPGELRPTRCRATPPRRRSSISDANGNVVYSGSGETDAGAHSFVWNGKTTAASSCPTAALHAQVAADRRQQQRRHRRRSQSIGTVSGVGVEQRRWRPSTSTAFRCR